jgi:porin
LPTKSDAYTIYYGFDQYLKLYSNEPDRGWGLFARASISDANPTPLRYFLSTGIGGDSPLGCHRGDTFGIGWFYVGASDEFGPVPRALLDSRDGGGVELFYNFKATPWLNITPDLQIVKPGGIGAAETAFIYGLRVNMKL